jgi:hypothetical protein
MAKDNRKIHSGIRHEGTTYKAGMEDELSEALTQKQLNRLTEKGSISGNWKGSAPADPPAAVEVDDVDDETEENDGLEQVDQTGDEAQAPASKKSIAKKSSSKKSSSKKSAK